MLTSWNALLKMQAVFNHVRCVNCHTEQGRPIQFDGEKRRFHNMYVHREGPELGQKCSSCHRSTNSTLPGGPPGGASWGMPSKAKALNGKLTPQELCRMLMNPKINFFESGPREKLNKPRTVHEIVEHLSSDALVKWAWEPGGSRVAAPGTHEEFIQAVKTWVENAEIVDGKVKCW